MEPLPASTRTFKLVLQDYRHVSERVRGAGHARSSSQAGTRAGGRSARHDPNRGKQARGYGYMRYSHTATLLRVHRIGPSGRLISSSDGSRSVAQAHANTIALSATMAETRRWLSVLWIVTVCSSLQFDFA